MNLHLLDLPLVMTKIITGLGSKYKEISVVIRARDTPISYEELFDKRTDHETFLNHEFNKNESMNITSQ